MLNQLTDELFYEIQRREDELSCLKRSLAILRPDKAIEMGAPKLIEQSIEQSEGKKKKPYKRSGKPRIKRVVSLEGRTCEGCGIEYQPRRYDQRFHNKSCQRAEANKTAKENRAEDKKRRGRPRTQVTLNPPVGGIFLAPEQDIKAEDSFLTITPPVIADDGKDHEKELDDLEVEAKVIESESDEIESELNEVEEKPGVRCRGCKKWKHPDQLSGKGLCFKCFKKSNPMVKQRSI